MTPLAAFAVSGCLALSPGADSIRARDLAAALPQWSAVEADSLILPAPIPGVRRVLRASELRRLALRWNVAAGVERDLCFAIPVAAPDPARILAAMQRQLPAARIEILETSRLPAPDGEYEFPLAGLHNSARGGYWNGFVAYGHQRRFAVWARVRVVVTLQRAVAAEDLRPGRVIEPGQLRLESQDSIPAASAGTFVADLSAATGRVPRRTIPAGTPLRPEWLEAPKEIQRGETVQVEAVRGAAHLKLEGVAQAAGAIGEIIPVENPSTRRRFPARVEAKGKVIVKGTP
jgi:flagella basal body P-ring formation protein FlgA